MNLHVVADLGLGKLDVDWALFAAISAHGVLDFPVFAILIPIEAVPPWSTSEGVVTFNNMTLGVIFNFRLKALFNFILFTNILNLIIKS